MRCRFVGMGLEAGWLVGDIGCPPSLPVMDGAWVFSLMDTQGLPWDFIQHELRLRRWAFDAVGFIQAAWKSGNFSKRRIAALVEREANEQARTAFLGAIEAVCV